MNKQMKYSFLVVTLCVGLLWADAVPVVLPATAPAAPATVVPEKPQGDAIGVLKLDKDISFKSAEALIKKSWEFAEKPNIKGVLLVVDCGGGSAGASELLFREIKELAASKPVVALVANYCGSGAYYTAIGAHWIVTPASAALGHIGSVMHVEKHRNLRRATPKGYSVDADIEVIHAGKDKAMAFPNSGPLTPEQRAKIQATVDASYKAFYTAVAKQRNLSLNNLDTWAEGRTLLGEEAVKKGLADQVGGYSDAVKKVKELVAKQAGQPVGKLPFVE